MEEVLKLRINISMLIITKLWVNIVYSQSNLICQKQANKLETTGLIYNNALYFITLSYVVEWKYEVAWNQV